MTQEKNPRQFPASPKSGWLNLKLLPSRSSTADSQKGSKKIIWGTIVGLGLIILTIPLGLLIVRKLRPAKPATYLSTPGDECCSGTPECQQKHQGDKKVWRCVRKDGTSCESKSVCKDFPPGSDPSHCDNNNDCAAWEVCQDGHCRSRSGCTRDSDCADGAKCVNGTCQGIKVGIECYADSRGVKIINKTGGGISGNVDWFASWCNNPKACGYCGGEPNHEYITLKKDQVWTRGFTNSENKAAGICDWQTDLKAKLGDYTCQTADTGCDSSCQVTTTPTPTPTVPLQPTSCHQIVITQVNDQPYQNQILKPQDVITLRGYGYTDTNKTIDQLHFTVFKGSKIIKEGEGNHLNYQIENNKKRYSATYQFTIPSYGDYSVSLAVHSPEDGWFCTN